MQSSGLQWFLITCWTEADTPCSFLCTAVIQATGRAVEYYIMLHCKADISQEGCISALSLHCNTLTVFLSVAVGQFKQLVELSNTDPSFNEKLKQYLIPNKAREHVALAVENDKRLRMWYPEPNNTEGGLLYRSVRARVDLEHPDGQLLAALCHTFCYCC